MEYEKDLFKVLRGVNSPMAFVKEDRYFVEVNPAFTAQFGWTNEDLEGKTFLDITHDADKVASEERFDRLIAGQSDEYTFDKQYISKDQRVVNATVTVIRTPRASHKRLPPVLCMINPVLDREETAP